jgi:hypothetical protein
MKKITETKLSIIKETFNSKDKLVFKRVICKNSYKVIDMWFIYNNEGNLTKFRRSDGYEYYIEYGNNGIVRRWDNKDYNEYYKYDISNGTISYENSYGQSMTIIYKTDEYFNEDMLVEEGIFI